MPRSMPSQYSEGEPDGGNRRGGRRWRPGRRSRGTRHSPALRITGWASVFVVVVLTAGSLYAYGQYRSVYDSIHRVTITGLGSHRPPVYSTTSLNILVFGTDSRAGLSRHEQVKLHVGPSQGEQNTDTILLVHISPGRHAVTVVSFPRDTQVPYYSCAPGPHEPGQQQDLTATERINAVLAAGGVSCLWKTVEQQTGIRINHFIELHFTGFVKIINDVGGVNVCVNRPVYDSTSGLRLHKGENHIDGVAALKFWRTREGLGYGDDPQRIQRDQFLMASLLQGIKRDGLLGNPGRTWSVIKDVAGAMTTDTGMTASDLLHIAESMRGLSTGSVQFITAPFFLDPANTNLVEFQQPQAGELFTAIAHDRTVPKSVRKGRYGKGAAGAAGTALAHKTVSPSAVNVEVLNGSGVGGQAAQVASDLASRGFRVLGTGDAPTFGYAESVVQYGSRAQLPAARTLLAQVGSARLQRSASVTAGTVSLIIGTTFTALTPQPSASASASASPSPSASQSVSSLGKKYHGITGSASVCKDQSAFSGPLGY